MTTETTGIGTEVIHENDNYTVTQFTNPKVSFDAPIPEYVPFVINDAHFDTGYIVRNKVTKVVEHSGISLPEAIFASEQMNDLLLAGSWKWFAKRRDALRDGLIPDENETYMQAQIRQHTRSQRSESSSQDLVK